MDVIEFIMYFLVITLSTMAADLITKNPMMYCIVQKPSGYDLVQDIVEKDALSENFFVNVLLKEQHVLYWIALENNLTFSANICLIQQVTRE